MKFKERVFCFEFLIRKELHCAALFYAIQVLEKGMNDSKMELQPVDRGRHDSRTCGFNRQNIRSIY